MMIHKLYHTITHLADKHPYLSFPCLLVAASLLMLLSIFVLTAIIAFPIAYFMG